VLQDEEPHKLVLLTDAQFSPNRQSSFVKLECDRLLIDLAEFLAVQIQEHPNPDARQIKSIPKTKWDGGF